MKQVAVFKDEPVIEYTIENEVLKVTALNFGGSISGIYYKEDGTNMVASYLNKQDYIEQGGPYLNAIVGPVAGRIAYGTFQLDGKPQQLSINNGAHHLHGGASGVSKLCFEVEQLSATALHFHLATSHDIDGYPKGTFTYDITYTLDNDTLHITYQCIPPTISLVNMTSHLYFNLNGMDRDITHHQLCLPSTRKCRIEKECHPSEIYNIKKDSAYDFSTLRDIETNLLKGDAEFQYTLQYDTPFLLDDDTITLYDPSSQHRLDIKTDQSSVVVYTANWFDQALLFENHSKGYPMCSIALETQDIPNGINIVGCETNQVFTPENPYHQHTSYTFTKQGE